MQLSKRALQANLEVSSYAAALELENRGQALLTRSPDMAEALAAFKEKRPPSSRERDDHDPGNNEATMDIDLPELETLAFEVVDGDIGILRINRPERMNSQTVRMFSEYGQVAFALRDERLRALIVTGAGERAFCAGFDLDELDVITRWACASSSSSRRPRPAGSSRSGTFRSR